MKTYRYILLIVGLLFFSNLYAQNEEVKRLDIIKSLKVFFDNLSNVNDEDEPMPASYFASRFGNENVLTGGGHYFRYNGQETSMSSFVQSYAQKSIEGKNINHKLDISNISYNVKPINTKSSSDQRWKVNGTLIRSNAHFEEGDKTEDYLIKSIPIELIVRYNGEGKDISILEINITNPQMQKVTPLYRDEIVFTADRGNMNTNLSADGGQWYCNMQSYSKRIKYYPGFNKMSEKIYPLEFEYELLEQRTYSKIGNIKIEKMTNNQRRIFGTLSSNYSKENRSYALRLFQKGTNKEYVLNISQYGAVSPCIWCDFFDVDNSRGLNQANISYSLKYGIGLAYKHHFEYTRFSLGGHISTNFDTYRGIQNLFLAGETLFSISTSTNLTLKEDMYEVESETVKPNSSNYSSLLDPKDEAKKYTARSLFLIQPGIDVTNWFNFTLGVGLALSRNKYYLETAYGYTKYSYKKLDASLPDIDDVYSYKAYYKNYYYKDPIKCHFAIQPAMDFRIPLGGHEYLNLGVSYVLTSNHKDGNSLDFSIGYTWRY